MTGYGLGVDLGTTYTAAATWRDGRAESVALGVRAHTVPSVLFLREDGVLLVGEAAERRGATEPERVAREFKRRFGDGIPFHLGDKELPAEMLAAQLLRWVVEAVAEREGERPAHVTLTHPATWGRLRTDLLVAAAEEAGLTDVGLIPEPVAAAAYYASTERLDTGAVLAIYDLGGGTFDVTVVRKTPGGFAVEGRPGGDERLGGIDFDQTLMDHVAATLGPVWTALDFENDDVLAAIARVREQAVEAKEALSADVDADIPVLLPGFSRGVRISRGEFESTIRIPILRTIDLLAGALETAGVAPQAVRSVLLVGGSSRIPLVSRLIASELGIPVALDAHPKFAICLGAAIATGARLTPSPVAAPPSVPQPTPTPARPPHPAVPRRPDPAHLPRQIRPTTGPPDRAAPARPTVPRPAARPQVPAPVRATGAPVAAPDGAVTIMVDLRRTGITRAVDIAVPTSPVAPSWAPILKTRDEPLVVTHRGDRGRGRRTALLVVGAAMVLVLAVTAVALSLRNRPQTAIQRVPGTAASAAAIATSGRATFVAEPVTAVAGDRLRAVTAAGTRGVAVGDSQVDGAPRAWRTDDSGRWVPAAVLAQPTLVGGMNAVAQRRGELMAVGWVAPRPAPGADPPAGSARQAALWTSKDGSTWTLRTAGDLGAGRGLGELFDVVVDPAGGLVVAGVTWAADPRSGDGAVLRSADGLAWQQLVTTGLDGLGPATVRRLLAGGSGLIAVGSRLQAGTTVPVVWTSPDGTVWTEVAQLLHPGPGSVDAAGLLRTTSGALLVVGAATGLDGSSTPAVWSGSAPGELRPTDVSGGEGAAEGVAAVGGRVVAVGTHRVGGQPIAAVWRLDVAS